MVNKLPKIRVKFEGFDPVVVDKSVKNLIDAAIGTGAKVSGPVPLPTRSKKFAVNRSPFVYKSSVEHFVVRVHKRLVDIVEPTAKTIDALQHLQMPSGVGIEIQQVN